MNIKNILIIVALVCAYAYVSNMGYEDAQLAHSASKDISK